MDADLKILSLSARGLSNVFSLCGDGEFTFLLGSNRYTLPTSLAQYISPMVAHSQRLDPTFTEFTVDNVDDEGHCFAMVVNLARGESIHLRPEDALRLRGYVERLGNSELLEKLSELGNVKLVTSNAIGVLNSKAKWGIEREEERNFIAGHLHNYTAKDLAGIHLSELEIILSSKQVKIETESHLFEVIQELVTDLGEEYEILYEYLMFDYLGEDDMKRFLQVMPIGHVSERLWEAVGRRLVLTVAPKTFETERFAKGTVPFTNDPFDGIAAYLRKESGQNPVSIGAIDIDCLSGNPYAEKLFDPNWKCYWSTKDAPGQWIMFRFPKYMVYLTDYTLKSPYSKSGWNHLKSWIVEGSNDGENWSEIDRHEENNDLNGKGKVMTWRVQNPMRARMIRLRQIGKNHKGTDDIQLAGIEFFGQLLECCSDNHVRNEFVF
jgi:hypothetical protein